MLSVEGVMHGLYLLWWVQEKHVSPALVAAILAAGDLAIATLEIPAGWLADRYGHRASLIVGSAAQAAGMLACWKGNGFAGLLAASLLVALGDVFRSGADQALLYRSCVALDREPDFQAIESRTRSLQLIAFAGMTFLGGLIVQAAGFAAGWIAEIACSVAGAGVACAMVDPVATVAVETPLETRESPAAATRARLRIRWALVTIILPVALLDTFAGTTAFVLQTAANASPRSATVLVTAITVAEAFGAIVASRMVASVRILVSLASCGGLLIAACFRSPDLLPPAAIALAWLQGIAAPLRATAIQRRADDHERAQAASLASAIDKTLSTFGLLAAGWWR